MQRKRKREKGREMGREEEGERGEKGVIQNAINSSQFLQIKFYPLKNGRTFGYCLFIRDFSSICLS